MYMDIQLADVNGDKREDLITSCGDIFLRAAGRVALRNAGLPS